MASALWVVRPALLAILEDAAASSGATVYDGPRPRGETPKLFLLVGANSGLEEGSAALRSVQSPSSLSGTWREEIGEIDCVAVAWTGEGDMTTIRNDAKSLIDACEAAINADRSLGGVLTLRSNLAELTRLDIREERTDKGPFVEATFTVSYGTVLTS